MPMANDLVSYAHAMPVHKNQKEKVQRAFGLVNMWGCRERGALGEGRKLPALPVPHHVRLCHLDVPGFYPASLHSVSGSSKLIEPEKEVVGTFDL